MTPAPELLVGGLVPFTTIDFPGRLAAVVFCQGCPWQCDYCYNRHLWGPSGETLIPWGDVLAFLEKRQGMLDGVVFSGGEASLQPGLPEALRQVRALGYATALHTNGVVPELLQKLLPLLDWVGLDVKAPFSLYEKVTKVPHSGERAARALDLLLGWGGVFETRTTVDPALLSAQDLESMAKDLSERGVEMWALQPCRREDTVAVLDDALLAGARRFMPGLVVR